MKTFCEREEKFGNYVHIPLAFPHIQQPCAAAGDELRQR